MIARRIYVNIFELGVYLIWKTQFCSRQKDRGYCSIWTNINSVFFSLTSTQCQTLSSFIVHLLSFFFFSYDLWLRPFTRPLSLSWQKPTISSSLKSSSNRSGQMHLRLALLVNFALLSLITLHHQAFCATLAYICLSKCPPLFPPTKHNFFWLLSALWLMRCICIDCINCRRTRQLPETYQIIKALRIYAGKL